MPVVHGWVYLTGSIIYFQSSSCSLLNIHFELVCSVQEWPWLTALASTQASLTWRSWCGFWLTCNRLVFNQTNSIAFSKHFLWSLEFVRPISLHFCTRLTSLWWLSSMEIGLVQSWAGPPYETILNKNVEKKHFFKKKIFRSLKTISKLLGSIWRHTVRLIGPPSQIIFDCFPTSQILSSFFLAGDCGNFLVKQPPCQGAEKGEKSE